MALSEICAYLNNYFDQNRIFGEFTVADSQITYDGGVMADFLQEGQYFRIVGSVFNDGIYQYSSSIPIDSFHDETFTGAIWAMAIPPDLIALSTKIDKWIADYGEVVSNPYQSESFGGYSYSKASGGNNGGGGSWQNAFASDLSKWRKIRCRF